MFLAAVTDTAYCVYWTVNGVKITLCHKFYVVNFKCHSSNTLTWYFNVFCTEIEYKFPRCFLKVFGMSLLYRVFYF
jgi:hypothetical protein